MILSSGILSVGILTLLGAGCTPDPDRPAPPVERGDEPTGAPAPATLRRLTAAEYAATLTDLFGDGIVLPTSVEPDLEVDGLSAVGAGQAAMSPLGVERYEAAAYLVAEQVAGDPANRARFSSCDLAQPGCIEAVLAPLVRLAWRRTPSADELGVLAEVAAAAQAGLGTPEDGLAYAIAAVLQAPSLLYRVELGEGGRFTSNELASRMSYLLWAGPPDVELLDLADQDLLVDPEVRRAQAERMLADPRARRGLRVWADDWLGLGQLPTLPKDPTLFEHWGDGVGAAAREQTLATLEWLVFDSDADVRELMTTRTTVLDRSLAALYAVQAPVRDGFGLTELPADGPRVGLLGQVSFLALQAHSVSSSVTRRGVFVHQTLLCREIPPPPANVDTSIPEPSPDAPTMRDRVTAHLQDPMCATCHGITDPVGLAFEQFDGIGRFRTTENDVAIDPSGSLDDQPFADARGLARELHDHPDLVACLSETALRYAQGHGLSLGEAELAAWHAQGMPAAGFRWKALLTELIAADSFAVAAADLGAGEVP